MSYPANWYQDPENPALQRWFDGTAWTMHTRVAPPPPAPPPLPVDGQWPRRAAVAAAAGCAAIAIGQQLGGFLGSVLLLVLAGAGVTVQVFWIPEWRERTLFAAATPPRVHPSALWWGRGSVWDGNRMNPLHRFLQRSTRRRGIIVVYPGALVFHDDHGPDIVVRPDTALRAYRTTSSIWLHTPASFQHDQPERSWTLAYRTAEHALDDALGAAGFR